MDVMCIIVTCVYLLRYNSLHKYIPSFNHYNIVTVREKITYCTHQYYSVQRLPR